MDRVCSKQRNKAGPPLPSGWARLAHQRWGGWAGARVGLMGAGPQGPGVHCTRRQEASGWVLPAPLQPLLPHLFPCLGPPPHPWAWTQRSPWLWGFERQGAAARRGGPPPPGSRGHQQAPPHHLSKPAQQAPGHIRRPQLEPPCWPRPPTPRPPGGQPASPGSWWRRSGSQCGPRPPSWVRRCGRGRRQGRGRRPGRAGAG